MAFLFLLELIRIPFKTDPEISDFLSVIFSGFSLFPIFGYAYRLAIGNKPIAITTFGLNAALALIPLLFGCWAVINDPGIASFIVLSILILLMGIYLYPQFMYAFKSDELWDENA